MKLRVVICALILQMATQGCWVEYTDPLSQGGCPQSRVSIPGPTYTLRWTPGCADEMSC